MVCMLYRHKDTGTLYVLMEKVEMDCAVFRTYKGDKVEILSFSEVLLDRDQIVRIR